MDKLRIIPEWLVIPEGSKIPEPPKRNTELYHPEAYSQVDYVNQPYMKAYKQQASIPPEGYVDYDTGMVYRYTEGGPEPTGENWGIKPLYLHDAATKGFFWYDENQRYYWSREEPQPQLVATR